MTPNSYAIVTPSCLRDLSRCRLLTESIARFAKDEYRHIIIVEGRDLPAFREFTGPRIKVLTREDLIPNSAFDANTLPNGWIMQQLIKLSASDFLEEPYFLFADSDIFFLKSFSIQSFLRGGKLELFCEPAKNFDGPESKLMQSGPRILKRDYVRGGFQYVMQAITWRRDTLLLLKTHIQEIWNTTNWFRILCREDGLSEYSLYGEFVTGVLNDNIHHFMSPDQSRCAVRWTKDFATDTDLRKFIRDIPEGSLSGGIQSCIGIPSERYEGLVRARWGR